jgi:hypothetical protein
MKFFALAIFLLLIQEPPYKAKEDFEVKLEYQFKQRPAAETNSVKFDESRKDYERRTSTSLLPYLKIRVNLLKLAEEEVKMKVSNNLDKSPYNKKIQIGTSLVLDLGFTDDIKDRISAHEYNLMFMSPEKKELSRIHLFIEEDGTFLVNGEKRGKF